MESEKDFKMFTTEELDSTTKNVVQEIMRECTNRNIPINDSFVIYYVKLLMLDPGWEITTSCLPVRNNVQKFVKQCVLKLENELCPCIRTLKMQLYFMFNFSNVDNMITKNRNDLKGRLEPLEREVLETEGENKEEMNKLYKKIVYLVTLYSGLGNPTIKKVYSEAEAALHSIFSLSDLKDFIDLTLEKKETQIVEFTELVTGIRLFNRDCEKGGVGIEDLPKLLTQAIEVTNNDIQKTLNSIMSNVNMFTTAVDNCFKVKNESHSSTLCVTLPDGVELNDLEHIKNLLVIYRQYELFVRKILVEIDKIEVSSQEQFANLQNTLTKLHETVRFRIAIPTIQVFPLFSDISHMWYELQDLTVLLSQFNQMLLNLQMYMKELVINEEALRMMIGPDGPVSDAERLEKTTGLVIAPSGSEITVVDPTQMKESDEQITLEYLGFCAWKFVETDGGLIPGNPNMGLAKLQGKYYTFSSPEAAAAFGTNPMRYILRGLNLARNKPELINLLQLQEQLIAVQEIEELVVKIPEVIEMYDNGVQTDVHPVETKIDPNYMWNVWDWKRQAILLANISRCATKSTQTHKSNAWNAARTQTQTTKDFHYQTKKDNYTNVPTLSNFIYGLRGRKDDVQHIISLTQPVDK